MEVLLVGFGGLSVKLDFLLIDVNCLMEREKKRSRKAERKIFVLTRSYSSRYDVTSNFASASGVFENYVAIGAPRNRPPNLMEIEDCCTRRRVGWRVSSPGTAA